ncbi:alpha-1,4-glucan--maltose-1-phosphate maltosyltransferase [Dyadobacter psychrotolerans]|uniref:Alpha-1,4-glucan:maltose-1-phosphate maltosyltransferase n=1 Tax=Dyadobacter psychrotolerans TaxID=2541721 RepID=A0A4R5DM56_9BACT|nr:alpha-1,4-glucan--maltose-1-phosphate maltosyltransferase [Dyadobacter psychrotolerans]TDE15356.1 alpha-1,4-glucan--maltose-1-phosphate maltosyltransferase [Dyadobacter psychrotolerans]
MNILNGRERVIISGVTPQIEGGRFPAKRAIGESLTVAADIFTDGHDEIAASILLKQTDQQHWTEFPMVFLVNDRWQVTLPLEKTGLHEFQVIGWIDHFTSWKKGLVKKYDANQDVSVELQIGSDMLSHALTLADEQTKNNIEHWIEQIGLAPDIESAISIALGNEIAAVMRSLREKDLISKSPDIYKIEVERKKAGFSTWYELFPRSASTEPGRHGNFQDVKKLLPGIAKMGFDTLYFPPIHPIGEQKRKGKNNSLTPDDEDPGSPWAIGNRLGGHKAIHPELGTIEDFVELVDAAKDMNIEIAMDIAYQCAPDHPYVKEHPQWFKWRPDGTVQYAENPPKKYEDILPFNFETEDWPNLWRELKSVIDYWIEKGVRIFRIDNPHTKSFAFWEWMIGEVRQKYPEVIFLAEAFTRPRVMEKLAKSGFNQSYSYFTWRNSKWEFEQYLTELTKTDLQYYFRPNFWPNTPDILPHHLVEGGENAHIMRLILAATMSSNYGLYGPVYEYGVNTPHPGKEEYTDNEKYEIKHWNWERYSRTREIITLVNHIRKENPALQTTWNIDFTQTNNDQVICYSKTDAETSNSLIIAVNLDAFNTQGAHIRVPLERFGMPYDSSYTVKDMLSGEKYHWQGEYNFIQLNPYDMPAHIFKIEKTNQN